MTDWVPVLVVALVVVCVQHICCRTRNSVYQEKTASGRSLSPADTVITLD
jgi:hypothetical protein